MAISFHGFPDKIGPEIIENKLRKELAFEKHHISVSFNIDYKDMIPMGDFKVLLLWEPSVVMPWQYNPRNWNNFDLVIPMSSWRARRLGLPYHAFQSYDNPNPKISAEGQKTYKIVMINSAKFSAGRRSNYGLRRRLSRQLCKSGIDYALFGENWHMPKTEEIKKRLVSLRNSIVAREAIAVREVVSQLTYRYPEYRGPVKSKFEILRDSELCLVIENESDCVTEKLFDAIVCGSVPIYVGPDLGFDFPELESCLIRFNPLRSNLINLILNLDSVQLELKRRAISNFLNLSEGYGLDFWSPERQWSEVASAISAELKSIEV